MKKILSAVLLLCIAFLSSCTGTDIEKKISFEDHEAVTINYTVTTAEGEGSGTVAYKKTETGYVFYEITVGGTEYVCVTEGEECASFIKALGADSFIYQQVEFEEDSGFGDDADYYRFTFGCYGFDYESSLGELEFKKLADKTVNGKECYVYSTVLNDSEIEIAVDKESGIWMQMSESGGVYTVTGVEYNANVIPNYTEQDTGAIA